MTFNQIGETAMRLITGRTEETIPQDAVYNKRWVRPLPYDDVRWFDEFDDVFLGEVTLPTSATVRSMAMAVGRQCDQVLIDAALGTAYEGEAGTSTITFTNDNGTQQAAGGTNLDVAKLRDVKETLDANEAGEPDNPADQYIMLITSSQVQSLLADTTFTSGDYNTVRALVRGEPVSYMGFHFIRTELLSKTGNNRSCIAYAKSGLVLAMGERQVKISIRDDRNEAIQTRTKCRLGATRLEGKKFVEVLCDETA